MVTIDRDKEAEKSFEFDNKNHEKVAIRKSINNKIDVK